MNASIINKVDLSIDIEGYMFKTEGSSILRAAWLEIYGSYNEKHLPNLKVGDIVNNLKIDNIEKFTKPKSRFNASSLLALMDKEKIGTKATRAMIIDTLIKRGYITNRFVPTTLGFTIYEVMNEYMPDILSVSLTREIEEKLEMIEEGDFREDLYFRLSEISLTIPPLKDREGDALLLAQVFVQKFARGRNLHFSTDSRKAIENWDWPGNIRELENRIKRACIMSENTVILPEDLELPVSQKNVEEVPLNLRQVREEAEQRAIVRALGHCENNLTKAARLLGVSRPTLYNLLEKYDLVSSTGG